MYIQILSIERHCTKQNKEINCRNLATKSHHKNKNTFNLFTLSVDGLLQKTTVCTWIEA